MCIWSTITGSLVEGPKAGKGKNQAKEKRWKKKGQLHISCWSVCLWNKISVPDYCSLSSLLTNYFLYIFYVTLFSILYLAEIGPANEFSSLGRKRAGWHLQKFMIWTGEWIKYVGSWQEYLINLGHSNIQWFYEYQCACEVKICVLLNRLWCKYLYSFEFKYIWKN